VSYLPQLTDPSKRVLQLIRERGVVSGWQILSETGVTDQQLLDAANQLVKFSLVLAKGNIYKADEIGKAYFSLVPSSSKMADQVLKS
jgi:predicted transcriptional regulator